MKRTTIFVPEALEHDLHAYARREGKATAAIVREALEEYLVARRQEPALPSFAGVGASGRTDIAEAHEDLLFEDLQPHTDEIARRGSRRSRKGPAATAHRAKRR